MYDQWKADDSLYAPLDAVDEAQDRIDRGPVWDRREWEPAELDDTVEWIEYHLGSADQ